MEKKFYLKFFKKWKSVLISISPLFLGFLFIIPEIIIINTSQAWQSYLNYLIFVYIISLSSIGIHRLTIKKILMGLLKYRVVRRIYRLEILKEVSPSSLGKKILLNFEGEPKTFIKRWLFSSYCCFGFSLTLIEPITNFFLAGLAYFLSPLLIVLFTPIYFVVKDGFSNTNTKIGRIMLLSIGFATVSVLTIISFVKHIYFSGFDAMSFLSLTTFILYNLNSNLLITTFYFESYHESNVNWFLNSFEKIFEF